MKTIHSQRLRKLARMIESDGKKFDYGTVGICAFDRADRMIAKDRYYGHYSDYFGITWRQCDMLFNVFHHGKRDSWDRKRVGRFIRAFVEKRTK